MFVYSKVEGGNSSSTSPSGEKKMKGKKWNTNSFSELKTWWFIQVHGCQYASLFFSSFFD